MTAGLNNLDVIAGLIRDFTKFVTMKKTTEGVIEVWLMSRGELCDRYDVFDLFSSSILL